MRWATHADRAELPEPRRDPGAAAAVAALLAPHKMALSERLAANGPWPHGTALLPEPGSAAAGAGRGTLAGAPAQPPEDAQFGRIFVCKRNTTSACFKRNVFVSNRCAGVLEMGLAVLGLLGMLLRILFARCPDSCDR